MENFEKIQLILEKNNLEIRHLNWGWALYRKADKDCHEFHITTSETIEGIYNVIEEIYEN